MDNTWINCITQLFPGAPIEAPIVFEVTQRVSDWAALILHFLSLGPWLGSLSITAVQ